MKKNKLSHRSHLCQILVLLGAVLVIDAAATYDHQPSEILVRRLSRSNSSSEPVPKILKLTQNGAEEVTEVHGEPLFTMKSDPVKVQSDFKTVDIIVLNRQRDKEQAKKVAIIQEDLQSRIKLNDSDEKREEIEKEPEHESVIDPEEMMRKQAKVKEDIESRVLLDDGFLGYRQQSREEKFHYPVKRSDVDYYADEPEPPKSRTTPAPPKEEDGFFSIFESLFGSSDDESQTKKKSKPEEEILFQEPGGTMKENIKTVGDILKPLKPVHEPEVKSQTISYQNEVPEYRIVNSYHSNQYPKPAFKPPEPKPNYSYYRPTEKPFRPYKPSSTSGYEDYDLEEFLDKGKSTTTRVKYIPPITTTKARTEPTTTSTTTTTTTISTTTFKTTTKNSHDNKLKFPSIQKKNDYINRNRYQEVKNEETDRTTEKVTERTTYYKPEIKTTTEIHRFTKPSHETKINEIKPQKIQESPNFYNLINLPVRYSNKDTAIPLISTSYANTKIQGMGAHKYEKNSNGKYPNHKYDQVNTSTTKRPNYWATKRTSTEKTSDFKASQLISKTTIKYDLDKVNYENIPMGLGPEFGGYGSKTGVEVKTQTPVTQTSTVGFKETTTKRQDVDQTSTQTHSFKPEKVTEIEQNEKVQKTSTLPTKDMYEEYEYDTFPAQVQEVRPSNVNQNYASINYSEQKNKVEHEGSYQSNGYKTSSVVPDLQRPEPQRPEIPEYEYYDYEDPTTTSTTTTTTRTTTSKYKIKYPSLSKDKIKSGSEKVAVVVPSKDHDFYENEQERETTRLSSTTPESTTATTTTTTTTPTPPTTTGIRIEPEVTTQMKKITTQFHKPTFKEPAPVFEDIREEEFTKDIVTRKVTTERPETTVKPLIVTSAKEQENNVNIVLVPTKATIKSEEKYSQPEPSLVPAHKHQNRPGGLYQSGYDYTTEFTVGAVQGGKGGPHVQKPIQGGHFVASSISTNPYGDDEPFRPIPNPPGISTSFQVVHENVQRQPPKTPQTFHNNRPLPTPPSSLETEPIHEPHEFIPSPQFHRPGEQKPENRPGGNLDYDFEGIQTEPKPGQYVIFSKPQLNPEMNENQLKKKPEVSSPSKTVSNIPHFHDKVVPFGQPVQKPFKEGQIYQNQQKPKPITDKVEQVRPIYGGAPEISDERLSLQLVPPRGTQTEKPFEGNFIVPEKDNPQESTISYPRPHWEKNGKPSFLLNKNDVVGGRHPPMPPQMAATLIPPSSIPPQRFRRPLQPHMPPMRKNFNEAGTNVKPKPNLPNILPQFRPNAKVGAGPYHRPPGYVNRRNGINRYHEKEHGSFPYHIQHPEKEAMLHREYEMGPEIIPKFITNRGKLPTEVWGPQGMQKRFGQGPLNIESGHDPIPSHQKILRRLQRTPVTTLQMLKQMPGVKTQKTHVTREDSADPSAPLLPPIYKTFVDPPKTEENVYIVYPAKAPQKLRPDNDKVFIVSDSKSQKNFYNFTKYENQHPLLNPTKKGNPFGDKSKNDFPYGFIKDDRVKLNRKQPKESEEKNVRADDSEDEVQEFKTYTKDEKIDMNLHMQSNNQWNEVRTPPDSMVSVRNPERTQSDHYRSSEQESDGSGTRADPPSQYHTSIKDDNDSAFTLGAVMHTMSSGSRKGQVTSVSLREEEKENLPVLKVNERISNGKIVTVSMPLDVKQDTKEDASERYQFQAPFQASSRVTNNESHPESQGWSVVKGPEDNIDKSDSEDGKETTETSTTTKFNFENFKPELIGGFKPIYELPEELEEAKEPEKSTEREEKKLRLR